MLLLPYIHRQSSRRRGRITAGWTNLYRNEASEVGAKGTDEGDLSSTRGRPRLLYSRHLADDIIEEEASRNHIKENAISKKTEREESCYIFLDVVQRTAACQTDHTIYRKETGRVVIIIITRQHAKVPEERLLPHS